jgi:hypothetical protein
VTPNSRCLDQPRCESDLTFTSGLRKILIFSSRRKLTLVARGHVGLHSSGMICFHWFFVHLWERVLASIRLFRREATSLDSFEVAAFVDACASIERVSWHQIRPCGSRLFLYYLPWSWHRLRLCVLDNLWGPLGRVQLAPCRPHQGILDERRDDILFIPGTGQVEILSAGRSSYQRR